MTQPESMTKASQKRFNVWRMQEGRKAGCVDYLGTVEAPSLHEAEQQASQIFDCHPCCERLEVELAEPEGEWL